MYVKSGWVQKKKRFTHGPIERTRTVRRAKEADKAAESKTINTQKMMAKMGFMLVVLFSVLAVSTAQMRWRLIPSADEKSKKEEESTVAAPAASEKILPSTLTSAIRANRAFLQPQRTEETVQKLDVANEVKKASRSDETVIKREAPQTFSVDAPASGMAYSSFSSSTSTRLVDGKWVTETTKTEVKPSGADNRLRGTTTKEVKIEPAASEASSAASASTLFKTSSSSSSSSATSSSSSSSSSSAPPRSVVVISRGRPAQDDLADPFSDPFFSSPFSSSPFGSLLRSFAAPSLVAAPAAPAAPRQAFLMPRFQAVFPLNMAAFGQPMATEQAAQAPVQQLRVRQVASQEAADERK